LEYLAELNWEWFAKIDMRSYYDLMTSVVTEGFELFSSVVTEVFMRYTSVVTEQWGFDGQFI
jgi:hypothetical protein